MSANDDFVMVLARGLGRARAEGDHSLKVTRSWAEVIRAASYGDDKGGNRWEMDPITLEVHPVPDDPTGEAVVDPDELVKMHDHLKDLYRKIGGLLHEVEHIYDQTNPDPAKHPRRPDDELDPDRWCTSCVQDRGRLTPVAMHPPTEDHPHGRVRFKGLCRWCHDFIADYGRRPTASLIRKHHTPYVNVTETDVARALGRKQKASA